MFKPGGYASVTEADGKVSREGDTFTCTHCNSIIRVRAGLAMQAPVCRHCMGRICKTCQTEMHRTLKCTPFEERLRQMESRARFRRSLGS